MYIIYENKTYNLTIKKNIIDWLLCKEHAKRKNRYIFKHSNMVEKN